MKTAGQLSIATLCSLVAWVVAFYLSSLFLLLFDSNYHDGFAAVGGLTIGLIVAVMIFRVVMKKRFIRT